MVLVAMVLSVDVIATQEQFISFSFDRLYPISLFEQASKLIEQLFQTFEQCGYAQTEDVMTEFIDASWAITIKLLIVVSKLLEQGMLLEDLFYLKIFITDIQRRFTDNAFFNLRAQATSLVLQEIQKYIEESIQKAQTV